MVCTRIMIVTFHKSINKSGLVYTLLHRSFSICTNWEQVHREIETIKSIMLKNGYPTILIEKTVNYFLNKLFAKRTVQPTVQPTAQSNKNYQIILPYLGIFTSRTEKKINRALTEHLLGVKISFVYRASTRLRSLFSFKDRIPASLRSDIIYKYMCNSCNAVYIGETFRHQQNRFCEHMGISGLTGKELKCKKE